MSEVYSGEPVRIAMADDDISVRELVCNHINTLENCKVLIQAGDGQELLDKLKIKPGIDLVILDIIMDGLDGYTTAEFIKKAYKDMRILFYSICKTELALAQMAASGGHGLIRKGKSSSQIAVAIKKVMGGYYFFPDMEEKIAINGNGFSNGKSDKQVALSTAQIGFLQWAGTGKTYKEIADHMNVNPRQVDYIRGELFKRFHVKNRVALAILARQSGIVQSGGST